MLHCKYLRKVVFVFVYVYLRVFAFVFTTLRPVKVNVKYLMYFVFALFPWLAHKSFANPRCQGHILVVNFQDRENSKHIPGVENFALFALSTKISKRKLRCRFKAQQLSRNISLLQEPNLILNCEFL